MCIAATMNMPFTIDADAGRRELLYVDDPRSPLMTKPLTGSTRFVARFSTSEAEQPTVFRFSN